jgi:hypothetical protein
LLNRGRVNITLGGEGAQNVLSQAEIGKLSHVETFMWVRNGAQKRDRMVRFNEDGPA